MKKIFFLGLIIMISICSGGCIGKCERCKKISMGKEKVIHGYNIYLCNACGEYADNGGLWLDVIIKEIIK